MLSTLRRNRDENTINTCETASLLLNAHVLDDRECEDTSAQREIGESALFGPDNEDTVQFIEREVTVVVKSLKNKKAPGPDLIEVRAIKAAGKVLLGQLVRLFNGCLRWGVFPTAWKEGSLRVFLEGEGKDEKDPRSYRPICLLSVIGKLFEKLLMKRLKQMVLGPGRISARQFGFTPRKATEDAIVVLRRIVDTSENRYEVALLFDISGAFDNVWWPLVFKSLRERGCPRNVFEVLKSYFDNRRVGLEIRPIKVTKQDSRGCPQGSILGPASWNLTLDDLLSSLEESIGNKFVAYADYLLVVIEGDNRLKLEVRDKE